MKDSYITDSLSSIRERRALAKPPVMPPPTREGKKFLGGNLMRMNAYDRHQKFVNDYVLSQGKVAPFRPQTAKNDGDVLREQYRFIRTEEDDAPETWEVQLARKYYEKLFREYCIANLDHWQQGKIGLRWRTEEEVLVGKGQFTCGARGCANKDELASYEMNFAYREEHKRKQALVKIRLCPHCSNKLSPELRKKRKQQMQAAAGVPPTPSTPNVSPSPSPAIGRTTFPAGGAQARLGTGTPTPQRAKMAGATSTAGDAPTPSLPRKHAIEIQDEDGEEKEKLTHCRSKGLILCRRRNSF